MKGLPIRQILVVLLAIPALALSFFIYQAGSFYVGLALLVLTCLGVYIYLSPSANTFRYLFPGFLGFGLFVIFPLVYTILIGFTRYSSQNLLTFDRAQALFRQETFAVEGRPATSTLFSIGRPVCSLPGRRKDPQTIRLRPLPPGSWRKVQGQSRSNRLKALRRMEKSGRGHANGSNQSGKTDDPLKGLKFALPDDTLVGLEGLTKFTSRQRLWKLNPDGSQCKDSTILRRISHKASSSTTGRESWRRVSGVRRHKYVGFLRIAHSRPFFRIFLGPSRFRRFRFANILGGDVPLGAPSAAGYPFSTNVSHALYFALCGAWGLIDSYPQSCSIRNLGPSMKCLGDLWLCSGMKPIPGAPSMVLLVNIWLGYPYMMLICTGMLQSIPSSIYEASAIDGSNKAVDFFKLTLPLVLPAMIPILISSFAFNFNNFNLIFLLTAGGPQMVGGNAGETDLLVDFVFNIAFRDSGTNYGLAGAIATLLFILVGALSWINLKLSSRQVKL